MTAKVISNQKVVSIQAAVVSSGMTTKHPVITLFEAGGIDDGAYYPPQSMWIHGDAQVRALRDACNEALGEEMKPPTP